MALDTKVKTGREPDLSQQKGKRRLSFFFRLNQIESSEEITGGSTASG